jgi:hypothetical protein
MKHGSRYPDNAEILARKACGRRELARIPFAQKLSILDRMKERVAPIARARQARRANKPVHG